MAASPPLPPSSPIKIIPDDLVGKFRDYMNRFRPVANEVFRRSNINYDLFDKIIRVTDSEIFTRSATVEQTVFATVKINEEQKFKMIEVHVMILIYIFTFILFPGENNERIIEVFNTLCRELANSKFGGLNISVKRLHDLSPQFKENRVLTSFVNSHGGIRDDLYNLLIKIFPSQRNVEVEDFLHSVLYKFLNFPLIKSIIESRKSPVVIDTRRFQVSSIPVKSAPRRIEHDGIDPTLFTEEFAARRRRFVPINVDFDALLADIDMKDYTFTFSSGVATRNGAIVDKIFSEALRSTFPEIDSQSFVAQTVFEARVKTLYMNMSKDDLQTAKKNFVESLFNPSATANMSFIMKLSMPQMEKDDTGIQPFHTIKESNVTKIRKDVKEIYYPTFQDVTNGRETRFPPQGISKETVVKEVNDIIPNIVVPIHAVNQAATGQIQYLQDPIEAANFAEGISVLSKQVEQLQTRGGLNAVADITELTNQRDELVEKEKKTRLLLDDSVYRQSRLVDIDLILRAVRLTRYVVAEIDNLLHAYGFKLQWFDDIKRRLELLETGNLRPPQLSFLQLLSRLHIDPRRQMSLPLTFVNQSTGEIAENIWVGDEFLDLDVRREEIQSPLWTISPDPFWLKHGIIRGSSLLYSIIKDAEVNGVIATDITKLINQKNAEKDFGVNILFEQQLVPVTVIDSTNQTVVYDVSPTIEEYVATLQKLADYLKNIDNLPFPQGDIYVETISKEFARLLKSIGTNLQQVTCQDVLFYQEDINSTSVPTTHVDMFRFAERLLPRDRTLFEKLPTDKDEVSIYRDEKQSVKMKCDMSPELNKDKKAETKRITTFTELFNFFKHDDPTETKLQKYIKFVTFVYFFFDPINEVRPVIDSLIRTLSILYYLYIKRTAPSTNPKSPYEIISVKNFDRYNISQIRDLLFTDDSEIVSGPIVAAIIIRTFNLIFYRHAIISLLLDGDMSSLVGKSRVMNTDMYKEELTDIEVSATVASLTSQASRELRQLIIYGKLLNKVKEVFGKMSLSSFVLPVRKLQELTGVQRLLALLCGLEEDSLDYQLLRLIMMDWNSSDIARFNNLQSKIVSSYSDQYNQETSGRIVFSRSDTTVASVTNVADQIYFGGNNLGLEPTEFPLDIDPAINDEQLMRITQKIYSVKAGYYYNDDPSIARYLSNETMIKPCFTIKDPSVAPRDANNIVSIILPYIAECEGYIEVEGSSIVSNPDDIDPDRLMIFAAILEYPAEVVSINRADILLNLSATSNSVQFVYQSVSPYLPNDPKEEDVDGGLSKRVSIIRTSSTVPPGPPSTARGDIQLMYLVNMVDISSVVPNVVGYVKNIASMNAASRLLHPRPKHVWTSTPLTARTATDGPIYVISSTPTTPGIAIATPTGVDIFLPAVNTPMFLASFYSPVLQFEYLRLLYEALQYSEADLNPGGTGNKTQTLEDLNIHSTPSAVAGSIRNFMIDDLHVRGLEKFRNILISQVGTRITNALDDSNVTLLSGVDLDRESMLFFSEQESDRSIQYSVTFRGYMNLYKSRKGLLTDVLEGKVTVVKNEVETREFMRDRTENINIKVNESNRSLSDPESQYMNELITKALWLQDRF